MDLDSPSSPSSPSSTSSTSSNSSDEVANLLTLPLEIRLEIYAYLLQLPPYSKHLHRAGTPAPRVHAALLRANHQICAEATPLLYARNTFLAHPSLLASLPRLRAGYAPVVERSALRGIRRLHVQVRLDCDLGYDAKAAAEAFSGLDELYVDVVQTAYLGAGCANLRRFEGIRGVRRVAIFGSTTGFEDYVEWLKNAMRSDPDDEIPPYVPPDDSWTSRMAHAGWD